ncbi:hypothetical protein B0H14DRAFT_3489072 [Mycena olivaceomarginata]|nr:hypothetical protein B0H14DRAFT_3489072 [Mycena olivaceomarginata]
MILFRGSSAADPWVLNNFGELVLASTDKEARSASIGGSAPAGTRIYRGPPSTIRPSLLRSREPANTSPAPPPDGARILRALREFDANMAAGRIFEASFHKFDANLIASRPGLAAGRYAMKTQSRAARDQANGTPRAQRPPKDDGSRRPRGGNTKPSTFTTRLKLVRRSASQKARCDLTPP